MIWAEKSKGGVREFGKMTFIPYLKIDKKIGADFQNRPEKLFRDGARLGSRPQNRRDFFFALTRDWVDGLKIGPIFFSRRRATGFKA